MMSRKLLVRFGCACVGLAAGSVANAEVKFGGLAEIDFFYKTNQYLKNDGTYNGGYGTEVAVTLNLDGTHETEDFVGTVIWRVAQKVATDWRYDSLGSREAWIGYSNTSYGTIKFGNQFSNLYLALDWPYGGQGAGNVWADFGAHESQYGRAISYYSPTVGGLSFTAQYDLGGYSNATTVVTTEGGEEEIVDFKDEQGRSPVVKLKGEAAEVGLNYTGLDGAFRLDAAYYVGKNGDVANASADVFGGSSRYSMGTKYGEEQNKTQVIMVSAIVNVGDFILYVGYKNNEWERKNATISGTQVYYANGTLDQALVRLGYTINEKNKVFLGYQKIFPLHSKSRVEESSATEWSTSSEDVNIINFQYEYSHTPNIVSFLQVRHHMLENRSPFNTSFDGSHSSKKDVTRILLGTAWGF